MNYSSAVFFSVLFSLHFALSGMSKDTTDEVMNIPQDRSGGGRRTKKGWRAELDALFIKWRAEAEYFVVNYPDYVPDYLTQYRLINNATMSSADACLTATHQEEPAKKDSPEKSVEEQRPIKKMRTIYPDVRETMPSQQIIVATPKRVLQVKKADNEETFRTVKKKNGATLAYRIRSNKQ